MAICDCSITLRNSGVPNCQDIMAVARKLIIVPTYSDAGVKNGIDVVNDVLNPTYWSDKVNATDASERWYPLPLIDNVEDTKNDPIVETLNSGKNVFIQEGTRVFTGVMVEQSAVLLGKLEAMRCTEISAYVVDKDGSLIGSKSGDYLYPVQIENNTFNVTLLKTTDTTSQKIQADFEWSDVEQDSNLRIITATEAADTLLSLSGLLDVNSVISAPTTTTFTNTQTLDFGTAITALPVKGWVIGDYSLYNNTTVAAIVITSVTESADGVYDFVMPAQTGSDSLTLSASKTGFEFDDVTFTV